jgi:DNA polymerase III delta subunit
MVYIFHGDDQNKSRNAFNQAIDQKKDCDVLRLDSKEVNPDIINNFINSQSLFSTPRIVAISNYFSISKPILDKITKIIKSNLNFDLYLWQDKSLTVSQLKTFSQTKIEIFPLDKIIFKCLNNLSPKNINRFIPIYHQVLEKEPFELFLFWVKFNLRRQLTSYSKFNQGALKNVYLQIIELDYQIKSGQLAISKEIALERILITLMK